MSSIDIEDDPSFVALSARLRHRIDSVFDSILLSETQSRSEALAGGFILEDLPSNSFVAGSRISLSEIPRALSFLGLSADDDIMGVFKNAASDWGAQNARSDGISKKDWRAVCAALLEGEHVNGSNEENQVADEDIRTSTDSGPDSDEYQMEELSSSTGEEGSSDEYEEPNTAAKAKKPHKAPQRALTKSSVTDIPRQLTESQKAQCRQEFSRFFPHVPDNELEHQRIVIRDVARVADLLKENLGTEEILEMLEAFSTSPDKSMDLTDFERMMILTKLV